MSPVVLSTLAIFRVCFYPRDHDRTLDALSGVLDRRRQSKLVSPDIEDHVSHPTIMIQIRGAERSPDFREGTPYSPFYDIDPSHKGVSSRGMFLPETRQQRFSNDPHVYIMYTCDGRTQAESCTFLFGGCPLCIRWPRKRGGPSQEIACSWRAVRACRRAFKGAFTRGLRTHPTTCASEIGVHPRSSAVARG